MSVNLWKPEYELDVESMDEQHKRFFELCLDLSHLCESRGEGGTDRKKIIRTIFELRIYAFHHFRDEEALMVKYGYRDYLAHLKVHDKYLDKLKGFVGELSHLPPAKAEGSGDILMDLARRLSDWAANWWGSHILEHDKLYAEHLRDRKKG